jgi:2-methylisocitrate lyase-like PEP mutase family enzyme
MPVSQADKAQRFRELHEAPGTFIIPNPWDGASARILAGLGFQALATSSGACAATLGTAMARIARRSDDPLRIIAEATDLPVSADLEYGFGDDPPLWRRPFASRRKPASRLLIRDSAGAKAPGFDYASSAWRPR